MVKRNAVWAFRNSVREMTRALKENQRLESLLPYFQNSFRTLTPQNVTDLLCITLGVTRWCEAVVLSDSHRLDEAAIRTHLIFRYLIFDKWVYLDRCEQLTAAEPVKSQHGQIKIAAIDGARISDFFLTMAFGVAIGENRIADALGQRLLSLVQTCPSYLKSGAISAGPVAQFILELFCRWNKMDLNEMPAMTHPHSPFQDALGHWHDIDSLEVDVFQLCEVHGQKSANSKVPIRDNIYGLEQFPHREYPTEVVFLQRVRNDLGLSVPNPEHPMLRSPIATLPNPCPRSGYDQPLADAYRMCREQMPNLHLPWEDEFQSLGPNDPLKLTQVDLFNDR